MSKVLMGIFFAQLVLSGFMAIFSQKASIDFPINLSVSQWKKRLIPKQYRIIRRGRTERLHSGV